MPQYVEASPTSAPGQGEEDCLYPISPTMLPSARPYLQPTPLTREQLYTIVKPPSPPPLPHPLIAELMNQLSLVQTNKSPSGVIQQLYYNTLPFVRHTSPRGLFLAARDYAMNDERYLPMQQYYQASHHQQQQQEQLEQEQQQQFHHQLRHSSLPR